MWAETTKDGKTKFREQYKDPLTGKYKKVSVTYDKNTNQTRRRAQIALEQKIQSKLRNIQDGNIKKNVTLGEVIKEWEPVYKKTSIIWNLLFVEHLQKNNKRQGWF